MDELIKQLGRPFAVLGVAIILASLATGANIMGVSVDPEKWIVGLIVGFAFIALSIYRNRDK